MKKKLLFFSRGRGYGHAIPDIAIADELSNTGADLEITFASYSTGAAVLLAAGKSVFNMGLPDGNPFLPTMFKAAELIDQINPEVVVTHEEFAALPAAALYGAPTIFLSAWFPPDGSTQAEALAYASSIIIIEEPGLFPPPVSLTVKPIFVGAPLRKMKFGPADRGRCRSESNIAPDTFLVAVITGGFSSEANSSMVEVIISAFMALPHPSKKLYWISERDAERVRSSTTMIENIEVFSFYDPIERLLVMADIVITKGTQLITLDCASLGIPSISLSPKTNPVDEILIPRVRSNIALNARAVDAEILLSYIQKAVALECGPATGDVGCKLTASTLRSEVHRIAKR